MAKSDYRFPIYSFDEVASMSSREWDEKCRSCGADMKPHEEDVEPEQLTRRQKWLKQKFAC